MTELATVEVWKFNLYLLFDLHIFLLVKTKSVLPSRTSVVNFRSEKSSAAEDPTRAKFRDKSEFRGFVVKFQVRPDDPSVEEAIFVCLEALLQGEGFVP